MRVRTIALVAAAVVVALIVTAIVVVMSIDVNQYRGLIAEQVKQATGRDLTIKGDLKLELGFSPAVAVNDVSFANATWGSRPNMAEIRRFEAQVQLLPLLFGDIKVDRIVLNDANILLETDAQGRGNWEFVAKAAEEASKPPQQRQEEKAAGRKLPSVEEVNIRNAILVYRDGKTGKLTRLALQRATLGAKTPTDPLRLDIEGAFNDLAFQVGGRVGSIDAMAKPGTPFPIALTGRLANAATFKVDGSIKDVSAAKGYEIALNAEGAEVAQLALVGGVQLPPIGPFKLEAKINDSAPGGQPSVPALKAEIGRADLVLARVEGSIRDPIGQKGIALKISAEGREIGALSGLGVPGLPASLPPIPALGPFQADIQVASGQGDRPTIPHLRAELGKPDLLKIVAEGAIQDPLEQKGITLTIAGDAPRLEAVAEKLGMASPISGPLKLSAKVADAGPKRYALSGLSLNAANSDLTGEASVGLGGQKPMITANLASNRVDLTKILPAEKDTPVSSPRGASAGGQQGGSDRVFSSEPLPLDGLTHANAELRYRAGEIITRSIAIKDANLALTLRDGNLAVRPLGAGVGGGQVTGDVTLAAANGAVTAKLTGHSIDVGTVLKQIQGDEAVRGGPTNFDIDLRGAGKSVSALMASLDGGINFTVGAGTFSDELTDRLGLQELLAIINKAVPRDRQTHLNCVVIRADINDGVTAFKALAVDTERLTLTGGGRVNLGTEQIDMRVENKTKVTNLLSLLPPILVRGTLAHPTYLPDPVGTVTGVVGGIAGTAGGAVGEAANVIGSILGQRGSQQQQTQAPSPCAGVPGAGTANAQPASVQTPAQQPAQQPQPSQQQQQTPQDQLRDLGRGLRGIFR